MTLDELYKGLPKDVVPTTYGGYPEGKAPPPPYLIYRMSESRNMAADGITYAQFYQIVVELYTELKDPYLERRVEDAFHDMGLFYEKIETYISGEKMFMILYETVIDYG